MKPFILIIESDAESQDTLSEYLAQKGFETYATPDARAALDYLERNRANIAIIGSTALFRDFLTGGAKVKGLPVILLEEIQGKAADNGLSADAVLTRPVQPQQVASSIVKVLSRISAMNTGSERLDEMIDETRTYLDNLRRDLGISQDEIAGFLQPEVQGIDKESSRSGSGRYKIPELVPKDIRENLHVIIVDGDEEFSNSMLELFQRRNYSVECAVNGQIALESMRKKHAQILITELRIPVLSGKALIAITKKEFRETAVVVATANPIDMPLKEALELGVDEYLIKPVGGEKLAFTAERAYYRHRAILKASLHSDRLRKLERELGRLRQRETSLMEELSASRERETKLRQELVSARKAIAEIKQTLDGSGLRKLLGLE